MPAWASSEAQENTQNHHDQDEALIMHPDYGYRYRLIHGIVYPPFAFQPTIDELRAVDWSRPGDVLIATYPKCGTTWMQQIILCLLARGQASKVFDPMQQAPWIERESSLARRISVIVDREGSADFSRRRCFKTHAPLNLLPCANGFSRGKIVVIFRNPKDAASSMYQHYRGLPPFAYTGPWSHFFEALFTQGKVGHGDYFDHVLAWRAAATKPHSNILWLSFEQLKTDLAANIRRVAQFLDIPINDTVLNDVVAASSFSSMKAAHQARVQSGAHMGSTKHFRKGAPGSWRSVFTVEQSEQLDAIFAQRMEGSDILTDFGHGLRYIGSRRLSDSTNLEDDSSALTTQSA